MKKILLIGKGKWGQNYIKTLRIEFNIEPIIATRDNWKQLIDEMPDGVIVCTLPDSHVEISSYALEKNIPTMIEKPLSLSLNEANKLKTYTAPILVNHIYLFSKQYQNIKQNITDNKITGIHSIGTNDKPPRNYSQLWDYGPHDISMIIDLSNNFPKVVKCEQINNGNYVITMEFDTFTSISTIGNGSKRTRWLQVDAEKSYKYEDNQTEQPLTTAIRVFIDSIDGKPDYRLGLDLSLKVIKILEYCQKSLFFDVPIKSEA